MRLLILLVLFGIKVFGQDTLSIMAYNLLNYNAGGANFARYYDLRTIINYTKPDVVVACEIEDVTAAQLLLDSAFNKAGVGTYTRSALVYNNNGTNSINMLFYKSSKIKLKSQLSIATTLRDIAQYRVYKSFAPGDTVYLYLHMAHLKAGNSLTSTPPDEVQRLNEVTSFCNAIATLPQNSNMLFCGDLNLKSNTEAAYNKLISTCTHTFNDPLQQEGFWNNNIVYKDIHTQSTRSSLNTGCCTGSTGGLDDRFDLILMNNTIKNNGNKLAYLNNSYKAIGNDGNHFNLDLLNGVNTSVPANVNQSLFNMSDHLPVVSKFVFYPTPQSIKRNIINTTIKLSCIYQNGFYSANIDSEIDEWFDLKLNDVTGRNLITKKIFIQKGKNIIPLSTSEFSTGFYTLQISNVNAAANCILIQN